MRAFALALVVLAACGGDGYRVKVPRGQLGTERARLRGVLATESGGHGEWIFAGDWTDELTLARTGDQLCVQLALRDADTDTLDDLDFHLALDGTPAPMTVDTFGVEPIAAAAPEDGRLEQAGSLIRGQVCTPYRPASRVELRIVHRRLTWRSSLTGESHHYQASYRWDVVE